MSTDTGPRGRRSGGREARRAARPHAVADKVPFITRTMRPLEILSSEGLELIEHNADTILEQVGIEFRDPEALDTLKAAGADVEGERVRFPRGMARSLVRATAPREFVQHARNPANDVRLGGDATVFAPAYGSPFVRDLDGGRRYGTIEDFRNFVKLAYLSPYLHHSGGTVTMQPTLLAGVHFVLHVAGWLEGGLAMGYEKFVLDADQAGAWHAFAAGVDLSPNGQALDAIRENGPGKHFLGSAHTLANCEKAFYRSAVADDNSFEQWELEGSLDAAARANAAWKRMLAEYQPPADRRGRRRGAAGVDRPAEGVLPRLQRLTTRRAAAALLALGETRSRHSGVVSAFVRLLVRGGPVDTSPSAVCAESAGHS